MVAPLGTGSLTATQVMSLAPVMSSVTRSTSPREYWPAGSFLLACSTGLIVFLIW